MSDKIDEIDFASMNQELRFLEERQFGKEHIRYHRSQRTFLDVLSYVGLSVSTLSLLAVVLTSLELSSSMSAALTATAIGILTTLNATFLRRRLDEKVKTESKNEPTSSLAGFLIEWVFLEKSVRDLVGDTNQNPISFRYAVEKLAEKAVISSLEKEMVFMAQNYRNNIMHGNYDKVTSAELDFFKSRVSEINSTLRVQGRKDRDMSKP